MKNNSDIVIKVEGLGKKYIISHNKESYVTLRDSMASGAKAIVKKAIRRSSNKITHEEFWALKNVTFDISRGQRVGIIGRNGAGKSTLLKTLTRIIEPTEGRIILSGKVTSLLEVGTGFHPELTGRENIYLNGAILGMSKAEIDFKFDEIVDFAGVEKFLDTPVKRYSSGMYVRLAFAVAANLDPEILIVDEVLAVGDSQFQKKCLGKMREVGEIGRTVLFVSHNMAAIQELCDTCIWLEKGKIIMSGKSSDVIKEYIESSDRASEGYTDLSPEHMHKQLLSDSGFKFTGLKVLNSKNKVSPSLSLLEPFSLEISGVVSKSVKDYSISYSISSSLGYIVVNGKKDADLIKIPKSEKVIIRLDFLQNYFAPGGYSISLGANGSGVLDWIVEAGTFHIQSVTDKPTDLSPDDFMGVTVYPAKWSSTRSD